MIIMKNFDKGISQTGNFQATWYSLDDHEGVNVSANVVE